MYRIPKRNRDLRRLRFFKTFRRVGLFTLWMAIWTISAVIFYREHLYYPEEMRLQGWRLVALVIAVPTVGIFLFRIPKLFSEFGVEGKIVETGLSHSYTHSEDPGGANGIKYDFRLKTVLVVETARGKRKRIRFEQKMGSYTAYRVGEEIVRFRGLPYPINPHDSNKGGYVCVACGRFHAAWQDKCEVCEHTLIDPAELLAQKDKKEEGPPS